MHAQVESDDQVLLFDTLAIKKIGKVEGRIKRILAVVHVRRTRLCILLLGDLNIVLWPTCGILEVAGVLDNQVRCSSLG